MLSSHCVCFLFRFTFFAFSDRKIVFLSFISNHFGNDILIFLSAQVMLQWHKHQTVKLWWWHNSYIMVQISCNLSFFIFFHVTLTLPVVSGKRKHIFKFVKTLWGNEWGKANPKKMKLKLQSWQWPFVFELPRNIPPSVEYKKGKVLLPHTFTLFDCFEKWSHLFIDSSSPSCVSFSCESNINWKLMSKFQGTIQWKFEKILLLVRSLTSLTFVCLLFVSQSSFWILCFVVCFFH